MNKQTGSKDSKQRRILLGNILGIGYGNANQIVSRLNNYGVSKEEFIEAVKLIEKQLGE